ncbi:unnamed protein product [Schistosoma margrebowiei]|uniref:Uncharacterized protein n=1 Tax=Schistosoma margrebowiei TaxID=48269 RepID=A0A3P8DHB5_9TREM|nr:unnamed protein product [Schistosoma margrebowiei]
MPTEQVQVNSQELFKRQLDLFLRTKDNILLGFINFFYPSIIVNIPRFLPGGFGDPLLLDTEAC